RQCAGTGALKPPAVARRTVSGPVIQRPDPRQSRMWLAIVIAAATIGMQDPQPTFADAYLDPGARELVRLARERRLTAERSIERYEALARERISLGIQALRRERMIYRRETAARIDWRRDGTVEMELLGAREAFPIAMSEAGLPHSLRRFARYLAFDPADLRLSFEMQGRKIGRAHV